MVKQDILDWLTANYDIQNVTGPTATGGENFYRAELWKVSGDNITRNAVEFVVIDEGGAGEAAYWLPHRPDYVAPTDQFIADVEAYIGARLAGGQLKYAAIIHWDTTNEIALGRAALIDGPNLVVRLARLYRDSGNITHEFFDNISDWVSS